MNPQPWNLAAVARQLSATPICPDRGPYTLTMRECEGSEEVLGRLREIPGPETRLHIGWGSFRNLDIVAARQSDYCLLCDINTHQIRLWEQVSATLEQAETAAEFCALLPERTPNSPRPRQFSDSMRVWLDGDRTRPQSWLADENPQRYRFVQELFSSGRLSSVCLDLIDQAPVGSQEGRFAQLRKMLDHARETQGVYLDTLYLSNIGYMLAQPKGFFGDLQTLLTQTADPVATMRRNLSQLGTPVALITAEQLREDASEDNLQWQTQLVLKN